MYEYIQGKISELTPHSNQNKKKFYVKKTKTLYVGIGINKENDFAKGIKDAYNADVVLFDFTDKLQLDDEIIEKSIPLFFRWLNDEN